MLNCIALFCFDFVLFCIDLHLAVLHFVYCVCFESMICMCASIHDLDVLTWMGEVRLRSGVM